MAHKLTLAEQVQLMLQKAETATPAEAEMLTKRAEKLMVQHGLSDAMIAAASPEAQKEKIIEYRMPFTDTYSVARAEMVTAIAAAFGTLRTLRSVYNRNHFAYIVGHESDVQRAVTLIESLMIQADRACRDWWNREGKQQAYWMTAREQLKARRQFYYSFGYAVAKRIRETVVTVTEEEAIPGAALVLVDRKGLVDGYVDEKYHGKSRSHVRGSNLGMGAGWQAGQQATINRSIQSK